MKTIVYDNIKNSFITEDVLNQCFEDGNTNWVDKTLTGNGATSCFLRMKPPLGKVNVIIESNIAVVKGKQEAYNNGEFPKRKFQFVYSQHRPPINHITNDCIIVVADSFLAIEKELRGKVHRIMIDESHTLEIQSSFRPKLLDLTYVLENHFSECATCFISASPNKNSRVDFQLLPKVVKKNAEVNFCSNEEESVGRCVRDIKSGEKVIIFTQDSGLLKLILDKTNAKSARIIAGESFLASTYSKGQIKNDTDSNLIICSSVGFEGWDLSGIGWRKYFFSNLAITHTAFFRSQMYQALGRARAGFEYAELCIVDIRSKGEPVKFIPDLEGLICKMVNDNRYSVAKKEGNSYSISWKGSKYKTYQVEKYLHFIKSDSTSKFPEVKVLPNKYWIGLHEELYDKMSIDSLRSFFLYRGIKLKDISKQRQTKKLTSIVSKAKRLLNIEHALKHNKAEELLPYFFYRALRYKVGRDRSRKDFEVLREYILEETILLAEICERCCLPQPLGAKGLISMLKRPNLYKEFIQIFKQDKSYSTEYFDKKSRFLDYGIFEALKLSVQIIFQNVPPKTRGFRDYNSFTSIPIRLLNKICGYMELGCTEVDIKNCNPRILFASTNRQIPDNFYEHKDRTRSTQKRIVNTALNTFKFVQNKGTTLGNVVGKAKQKHNAKVKLSQAGFPDEVTSFLIDNFFETKHKDALFQYCAYHEKVIIDKLISHLGLQHTDSGYLAVRRHDSIVILSAKNSSELPLHQANKYVYHLNQNNFFKIQKHL